MAEHPIQGIMNVTMDKIHEMVDANTIIGKPITTEDGTTILPVSKVSFGFASGGTDFDAAEALGIRAEHALALPGKCAPDTAGALIAQTVLTILQERGDLHVEPA